MTGLACSLAHRQSQAKIELLRNVGNEQKVLPPIRLCDSLTHIAISAKRRRGVYLCARIGDRLLKGDGGHQTGKRQRIWDVGAEFIAGQPHTPDSKNLNITDLTEVLIQRKLGC